MFKLNLHKKLYFQSVVFLCTKLYRFIFEMISVISLVFHYNPLSFGQYIYKI